MRLLSLLLILITVLACQPVQEKQASASTSPVSLLNRTENRLDKYWYQGKAELNRYVLEQNRYRNLHPGEVVLIFVTEDFRTDIQVKSEGRRPDQAVSTLKLNALRRFPTGLYDYSVMTSVFTPVEGQEQRTMKVSMSSQDWCGQSFMQLNLSGEKYEVEMRSYFEGEGDKNWEVEATLLEDELFNRIRIHGEDLPEGEIQLLPSTLISRLMHLDFLPVRAKAKLEKYQGNEFKGKDLSVYTLEMPELNRKMEIFFETTSPYQIVGWKDSYPSAFDRKVRTTKATLQHSTLSPYWRLNSLKDMEKREELGFGQ